MNINTLRATGVALRDYFAVKDRDRGEYSLPDPVLNALSNLYWSERDHDSNVAPANQESNVVTLRRR